MREVDPPTGAEAIHWRLLTTHPVSETAEAWRVVGWYQHRWCIEPLFRLLKSPGLQSEDSQVASAERRAKPTAVALKAACTIPQLVQDRDGKQAQPAKHVLATAEVDTIEAPVPTLESNTERPKIHTGPAVWLAPAGPSPAWAAGTAAASHQGHHQVQRHVTLPRHPPRAQAEADHEMRC